MNGWKKLLIALLCASLTLSTACSDDNDGNNNNSTNNSQNNGNNNNGDQDAGNNGDQDTGNNGDQDTDNNGDQDTDNNNDDDTGGSTGLTPAAFTQQITTATAEMYCEIIFNCPENADPFLFQFISRTASQDDCADFFLTQLMSSDSSINQMSDLVAAGTIDFDPDKAQACLDLVADYKESCSPWDETALQNCLEEALVPTLAAGESCTTNEECIDGFCEVSNETCEQTCVSNRPTAGEGEDCSELYCDEGLTCVYDFTTGGVNTCQVVVPVDAGEACNYNTNPCKVGHYCNDDDVCQKIEFLEQGKACGDDDFCQAGLTCITTFNEETEQLEGTCQPVRARGEACTGYNQCSLGLICNATDDEPGECVALQGVGEACDFTSDPVVMCQEHLECVDNVCRPYEEEICTPEGA